MKLSDYNKEVLASLKDGVLKKEEIKTAAPAPVGEEEIVARIIQAQIGTVKQSNLIEAHIEEYFKRWPSYKDKLTELEWYHLFLDFYDKIDEEYASLNKPISSDGWISVDDKPGEGIPVLIYDNGIMAVSFYNGKRKKKERYYYEWPDGQDEQPSSYSPSHWKSLPPPPNK